MSLEAKELLEDVSRRIGEMEVEAARAGLGRPQDEQDAIWNRMLAATAHMRRHRDRLIETMAAIEAVQTRATPWPGGSKIITDTNPS